MKQNSIELSRRKTGGGAVYQDLGNSCFSFLTPYGKDQSYDYKTVNNKILLRGLKDLGVDAQVAGRNDVHVQGKKVFILIDTDQWFGLQTEHWWKRWSWQKSPPSWYCNV